MRTIRQINIKSKQIYFFNDMTNISDFDPNLLNIQKVSFKSSKLISYEIRCIKDLNSSNSLCLVFNNLHAYIEKNGISKFLIFASTDKNKIILKNYTELWDEIKEQIELITGDQVIEYSKDFKKVKFETDDDLSLGKILNISVCVIIVRSVIFEEESKY